VAIGVLWVAAPADAAQTTDGYLYGTITTRSGNTYSGLMRWGKEEAFWDDLFHSSKEELPYLDYADEGRDDDDDEDVEEDEDRPWWQIFGRKVRIITDGQSRVFIARFGDIASIEVTGNDDAELTMKSGTVVAVSGYANDVGGAVHIRDAMVGDIEVPWKKIDTIVFKATPRDVKPDGYRLRGKMVTDAGDFEGYIQWDKEECLSSDKLDGDSEDGRMSIEMGRIRSIARRTRSSATVELKDGRSLVLDGTNDVDSSNRGILVEDPRYGRVEVPWEAFESLEFSDAADSGPGYDQYRGAGQLKGTVTDEEGRTHSGRIVFDLDESEGWEMLNGSSFDIEYVIPFQLVASIEPSGRSASRVKLRSGEDLRLEDSQDVASRNDGLLVLALEGGDKGATYIEWDDVKRIEFD
jgi:hypothetical protein